MSKDIVSENTSPSNADSAPAAMRETDITSWRRMTAAAMVLVVGVALSIIGSKQLVDFARERGRRALEEEAVGGAEQAQLAIDRALQSLGSVRAFHDATGKFSADAFSRFVKSDAAFHHGTLALGWVPRITHEQRAAFEHDLRPIGGHTARIFEANGHGLLIASPPQADYFPVQYLISLVDGELVQGMNLAALSWLRRPLESSIASGQTVTLLRSRSDNGADNSFILQAFTPVYDLSIPHVVVGSSRSALAGFAMGVFDVDQLFRSVFDARREPYDVAVFALTRQGGERQVFALRPNSAASKSNNDAAQSIWTREFQVGDQKWRAVFSALPTGNNRPGLLPYVGLVVGLLLTTLLSTYLFLAQWRTAQVLHLSQRLQRIQQSLFEQRVSTEVQTQLREQAQASEIAKTHLLLAASHDLRQPMQALGLYLGHAIAEDNGGSRWLSSMQRSFNSMRDMFDTLLDWSRLESGRLAPQVRAFDLYGVLERLTHEYSEQARAKGLNFVLAAQPITVDSDPVLLERVLRNLLSNAVRYTKQGSVQLRCDRRGNMGRLRIVDTGAGIEPASRQRLFEAFERGEQPASRHEGLGLGLAIAQQTLALLGHPLQLRSSSRRGSIFSIRLPIAETPAVAITTLRGAASLNGARILLVDDDRPTLLETESLLTRWGATVTAVSDFNSAVQEINHAIPDYIIADQFLPDGTGLSLVEMVEARRGGCAPVVVSGDANFIDTVGASRPDIIALLKPVSPLRLRAALTESMRALSLSAARRAENS
ncbi:MAG: CHASE domain-containing protein [Gammaproteobacteria bacterium]